MRYYQEKRNQYRNLKIGDIIEYDDRFNFPVRRQGKIKSIICGKYYRFGSSVTIKLNNGDFVIWHKDIKKITKGGQG